MPALTERELGYNEAVDAIYKVLSDKSERYYKVLNALDSDSFEQKLVSGLAYRFRGLANDIYGTRKRTAEEMLAMQGSNDDDRQ